MEEMSIVSAMHQLRTSILGEATVHAYEFRNGGGVETAAALVHGEIVGSSPLVRLHSRCMYGESFGSLDCDCLAQLALAGERIMEEGRGVIVYLEQEGRGSGLLNKARGYSLQQQRDIDTVDAYDELGLLPDTRSYVVAARILRSLGVISLRLMTNNPSKAEGLTAEGLRVEVTPHRIPPSRWNRNYLFAKQMKLGHALELPGEEEGSNSA